MKRIRLVILMLILVVPFSCRGYKSKSDPLSPQQVQISDMATALKDDAIALQQSAPAGLKEYADAFSDAAIRFQNLCLRLGSNSLESRKAFDQIMFVEAQISQSPELEKQPDFNAKWQELRKGRLKELAEKLGYRPEKLSE